MKFASRCQSWFLNGLQLAVRQAVLDIAGKIGDFPVIPYIFRAAFDSFS
jgi:hypothetical protein